MSACGKIRRRTAHVVHKRELRTYSATALETAFCNAKEDTMNGNLFVFRPGGPAGPNVFNDWPLLISAMSGVEGRKM